MQTAALLSDLKSLSACDHESALALVSVHQQRPPPHPNAAAAPPSDSATTTTPSRDNNKLNSNTDLDRARDLIALHYSTKGYSSSSSESVDAGLTQARADVNGVLGELYRNRKAGRARP